MQKIFWIVLVLLLVIDRFIKRPKHARSPLKATAASIVLPGLGQLYNGEWKKTALIWGGWMVLALLTTFTGLANRFTGMVVVVSVASAIFIAALVDAFRVSRTLQDYTLKPFNGWPLYLAAIGIALLFSSLAQRALTVKAYRIPTTAMSPTLMFGDHVIARMDSPLNRVNKRGAVVVIRYPRNPSILYVKRVVAFAGEEIEIRDSRILIDGKPISEPWAKRMEQSDDDEIKDFPPSKVPNNCLFVLGDNLSNSADSRVWGAVPLHYAVGTAEYVYFSWDEKRHRIRFDRLGERIE